jgi:hypothetical protein
MGCKIAGISVSSESELSGPVHISLLLPSMSSFLRFPVASYHGSVSFLPQLADPGGGSVSPPGHTWLVFPTVSCLLISVRSP